MDTEVIRQYIRDYSYIEGFQQAHRVVYRLVRRQGTLWLSVGERERRLTGLCEEYAAGLLLLLYENGVDARSMDGVLDDLCGPLAAVPAGRGDR